VAVVVLALLALAAGFAAWRGRAATPDRLWVFIPDPPWREDPPAHVAVEPGAAALPSTDFSISPATQSSEVACVAKVPGRVVRTLHDWLGTPLVTEVWWATGERRAADGGAWHLCVRSDRPPAPTRARTAR
jgi:hypothetical protein